MGNKTTVSYSKEELESFRIATVKRSNEEGAGLYDLFLSTKGKSENSVNLSNFKEIFVMPHDDYKLAPKDGKITCDFVIKFDYFICVKRTKESLYNKYKVHTESQQLAESTEYPPEKEEMKLVFVHSDFKQECLYFEDREEFEETEELFKSVNNVKGRKIAVLVNPVSGKRLARKYFREILSPILNISGITYDNFMTDSSTYVEEWVNLYEKESFPYTDIICIGGDGLFSQLVNALGKSPKSKELLKIPIGLLPCGSANAIC